MLIWWLFKISIRIELHRLTRLNCIIFYRSKEHTQQKIITINYSYQNFHSYFCDDAYSQLTHAFIGTILSKRFTFHFYSIFHLSSHARICNGSHLFTCTHSLCVCPCVMISFTMKYIHIFQIPTILPESAALFWDKYMSYTIHQPLYSCSLCVRMCLCVQIGTEKKAHNNNCATNNNKIESENLSIYWKQIHICIIVWRFSK